MITYDQSLNFWDKEHLKKCRTILGYNEYTRIHAVASMLFEHEMGQGVGGTHEVTVAISNAALIFTNAIKKRV